LEREERAKETVVREREMKERKRETELRKKERERGRRLQKGICGNQKRGNASMSQRTITMASQWCRDEEREKESDKKR